MPSRLIRLIVGCVVLLAGMGLMLGWMVSRPGAGELTSRLAHKPSVMTVAYKAYGNPEAASGKYWFTKVVLENTGKGPLRDVKVSYQVPDYITWTSPDHVPELMPGQSAVFTWYPKFPSSVTRIRSKTPAALEVKFEYHDGKQAQSRIEKREFALRGVTEFEFTSLPASEIVSYYDLYDNQELAAAYITDEDPAVKTYYTKISEAYGGIGVMSGQRDLVQLARSTYDYMVSTGMTYSGAKGVPESMGDTRSFVQSMRLPRDVIYGNSGLCVELAYLWAAVGQAAGAKPYLVFIPGHCFVILESMDGFQLPIECTMIGGGSGGNLDAAGTFEEAVEAAGKQLDRVMRYGEPLQIVDVQEQHAAGIRPPELEEINRPELAKFLDDLRARHGRGNQMAMNTPGNSSPSGRNPVPPPDQQNPQPQPQPVPPPQPAPQPVDSVPQPVPPPQPMPGPSPGPQPVPPPGPGPNPVPPPGPNPGPGPSPSTAGMTVWQDPANRIAVPYPSSWMVNKESVEQMKPYLPGYAHSAVDPQSYAAIDVVFFDGMDAQRAAESLVNLFSQMGAQPQTGTPQQSTVAGKQAVTLPMSMQGPMGSIQGAMVFITTRSGVIMVSMLAPGNQAQAAAGVFGQILSGIQVRD